MTPEEFGQFRDCPGKLILGDISFSPKRNHPSLMMAEKVKLENPMGLDTVVHIQYNRESGGKVITVCLDSGPAICRMCIDNGPHPPLCMNSHKHFLCSTACLRNNLKKGAENRPDWDGKTFAEMFSIFCDLLHVTHDGAFTPPDIASEVTGL